MKKCPKCKVDIFQSMEPKIANLANNSSRLPKQSNYWRCANKNCSYKEKV